MSDGDLLMKIFGLLIVLANVATAWAVLGGKAQSRKIEQPLSVSEHPEFVRRADFHKHAELNRESHSNLESSVQKIGEDVAGIKEARDSNAKRLERIEGQLLEMTRTLGEQTGALHQIQRRVS